MAQPATGAPPARTRRALALLLAVEAVAHAWLVLRGLPVCPPGLRTVVLALAALELLAATALVTGWRRGALVARVTAAAQLGLGTALALLLALGVGYLHGVYGAIGQGLGWLSLFLVAVIAVTVIVPALWLWLLARPERR